MAAWDDVNRLALALPETVEDRGTWRVRGKGFVWERPLRAKDVAELGASAPTGAILGVRVGSLAEKDAVLASSSACFTVAHFGGYCAVLVRLDDIDVDELRELITDAWLVQAPKRLAKQYLESQPADG